MFRKIIGNKNFYSLVLGVSMPIMIQNAVTCFVGLLDNIMVGQVGTLPMSGVSISNQLLTIYNLAIFGSVTAASLFGAQYAGRKDMEGIRNCFRFKLIIAVLVTLVGASIFLFLGPNLLSIFMDVNTNTPEQIATTMGYAHEYLILMLFGLLPFALAQAIGGTVREIGDTKLPMFSSIVAVGVNFVLNFVLIFGYLGFPKLGIVGAAIATVISRFAELGVLIWGVYMNHSRYPFFDHVFDGFYVPMELTKQIIVRGAPLVMNEVLWSIGCSLIMQCYSTRGLDGVAAYNIAITVQSIFHTVCIGMGNTISILVGQKLGAKDNEGAVDMNTKITFLAFALCCVLGVVIYATSSLFPMLYNTSEAVRSVASGLLKVQAVFLPVVAVYNCCYFTMRSGGKTVITFLFDSVFTCVVSLPVAFLLSRYTTLDLVTMFLLVQSVDLFKDALGLYLVKKRVWVHNLVVQA